MDLFAGSDFHCHVAPFPGSGDLLYAQLSGLPNPPQQKLRPIRCNGRLASASEVGGVHENGGVVDGESSLKLEPVGQLLRLEDCCLHVVDPVGPGAGHSDPYVLGKESRSSLDDDDDGDNSLGTNKEPPSRKRRKKMVRKLRGFVENLVMKVMKKQEQMHKQLVDMIENKERERIMREEAWKQKEIERIKKDEEARTQEISRNLALVSSIQKLLGQEIQIPQPSVSSEREEDDGDENIQKDFKSDLSSKRWPEVEVQALITLRTSLEHKFRVIGSKGSIWEEISEAMHNIGYNRSAKKCKEKWENINKYYKRTMGRGKKRCQNSKTCPYFDELDILCRNGVLNMGSALSNTNIVPKIKRE